MVWTPDANPLESSLTHDAQYRLLIEAVTDYAIYMLDPGGIVMSWNPGAQRFKGYRESEILGKHFSLFYTTEDVANGEPQRALDTAKWDGRFESEGWRMRKEGTRFWASVVIDAIRAADGTLLGFAKVTRDITHQKEAQATLNAARAALFQSQKMDAIGQLTGGVAHDFNNLLTMILSSLELVRKHLPNDPKIERLIDIAVHGALRGTSLTRRMLLFARPHELKSESIDLKSLVEDMLDLLRSALGPSVTIDTRLLPTLCTIRCDPNQLELALLNLALNARDAMPQGGVVTISVREERGAPGDSRHVNPGQYACISVVDTGEGMDELTLSRAIEPFYTTKGLEKGTGLGLSMVHGIVTQSHGFLVLKSIKGRGTTAELWFPLEKMNSEAESREAGALALTGSVRSLTVLAVDDDDLVLMNLVAMLEDLGHTVFEATSGKQALEILRHEATIDLIVAGQAMPHMTGAMLLETAKDELPNLTVILATGYAELPLSADVNLVRLAKPFRQDDLALAIADAFSRKRSGVLMFPARQKH